MTATRPAPPGRGAPASPTPAALAPDGHRAEPARTEFQHRWPDGPLFLDHCGPGRALSAKSLVRSTAPYWLFGAFAPRTPEPVRSPKNGHRLNTLAGCLNTAAACLRQAGAALCSGGQPCGPADRPSHSFPGPSDPCDTQSPASDLYAAWAYARRQSYRPGRMRRLLSVATCRSPDGPSGSRSSLWFPRWMSMRCWTRSI